MRRLRPINVAQHRCVVGGAALTTTVVKLLIAANTQGTNDVFYWRRFAADVHRLGPLGIYTTRHALPYNHPPLIGWMLVGINAITSRAQTFALLIRVPACVGDIVTALLIFEIVRTTGQLRRATTAGLVFAVSPVMMIISGFHGNTDPVFVAFALLAGYLLVVRDLPFVAGVSAAVAISIKLVPIVALPAIAVAAARDRARVVRLLCGFLAIAVPVWLPAMVTQWKGLKHNVFDYKGTNPKDSQWGIVQLARDAHLHGLVDFVTGQGRFLILAAAAAIPALIVRRHREVLPSAIALSLALFLSLSPTFGMQYLVWAAAGVLIVDLRAGVAYHVTAGLLLLIVYNRWNGGFPWDRAAASPLLSSEVALAMLVWAVLVVAVARGVRNVYRSGA